MSRAIQSRVIAHGMLVAERTEELGVEVLWT